MDRVLDLERGVEHVKDLLPAGHRLLGHVQDLGDAVGGGEFAHRVGQDR